MSNKIFEDVEIYVKKIFEQKSSMKKINRNQFCNMEPLHCPQADCNKCISVFTLESHFRHDHPNIAIVLTDCDARCSTEFQTTNIRYGVPQGIVLLSIANRNVLTDIDKATSIIDTKSSNTSDFNKYKPVMILWTARIANCQLNNGIKSVFNENLDNQSEDPDDLLLKNDKIILWLSSNLQTNYSYTVAVSSLNSRIREKYYGPLLSIYDNKPETIFNGGKCLILSQIHYKMLTNNGTQPLLLDVVIHDAD